MRDKIQVKSHKCSGTSIYCYEGAGLRAHPRPRRNERRRLMEGTQKHETCMATGATISIHKMVALISSHCESSIHVGINTKLAK